jgi:teichuronic acid biosynthesis glycosyltransferase TuaC
MKILVVCSGNHKNFDFQKNQAFIFDQIQAVRSFNSEISFDTFYIKGKGICGYLKNLKKLQEEIRNSNPDLIHAHGGVISLLSGLQRKVPVVSTFHGSDINKPFLNCISNIAGIFSKKIIFVSARLKGKSIFKFQAKSIIIPCGVDLKVFYQTTSKISDSGLIKSRILFPSSFEIPVKNYNLAKQALDYIPNICIVELKDKTRKEVNELINSVALLLMTSFREGSPQIIKEAMACNCPVVSTDVGDARWVIGETEGCYICSFDKMDIAEKSKSALEFARTKGHTIGRQRIIELGLDSESIANRIVEVYKKVADFKKT